MNPTLTNFAQGLAQDRTGSIGDFLAPQVPVGASIGHYKQFNAKNQFVIYETARAIGGHANRIKFEATDPTYNAQPQALELPIDDAERDAAGEDQLSLEQAKTDTLLTTGLIARENKILTVAKASLTAVSGKGVWSNAGNDPVAELDALIEAIAIATGIMPNRIAFGIGAWRVFRNHPKVAARQPGAVVQGLKMEQAMSMLLNPSIQGKVGTLSKDTYKFGKDKDAVNIVGAEVFIYYASDTPSTFDPSFMKVFTSGVGGVYAVRMYREEPFSDVMLLDWSEDVKVTSTASGRRLTIS